MQMDNVVLETEQQRKERWRSLYIIYFTMFLMSLGFSIVLTGVWPYLVKLDPSASKEFMGWVVAANPFGQMLFSPLFGWWVNKRGSVTLPLILSLVLFTLASAMYSVLEIIPAYPTAWMVIARFLVGVSSANLAVARSYLSAATKVIERTEAVSMVSLAQVLGFVVGPGLQAAVTPFGAKGFTFLGLPFNMYTMCGWINVALGIVNIIFFLPWYFKERHIAAREAMINQGKTSEKEAWKALKPDRLAAWTLIWSFFVFVFNFVLLETLGTSLTMDQFAWTNTEALYYMGLLMSVGAIVACSVFALIGPLCKRYDERKVLIWGGLMCMIFGRFFLFPYGTELPVIAEPRPFNNATENFNLTGIMACPDGQERCTFKGFDDKMMEFKESNNETTTTVPCPNGLEWCKLEKLNNATTTGNGAKLIRCERRWCEFEGSIALGTVSRGADIEQCFSDKWCTLTKINKTANETGVQLCPAGQEGCGFEEFDDTLKITATIGDTMAIVQCPDSQEWWCTLQRLNKAINNESEKEIVGCPSSQEWCKHTPRLTVTQFVIGYSFTTIGYPIGTTLIQTIFSKLLGPRPQGVWMGLLTGASGVARVLGPIFVGFIYTSYGTYHTFGITGAMLVVALISVQLMNHRLIEPVTPNGNATPVKANGRDDPEDRLIPNNSPKPMIVEMKQFNEIASIVNNGSQIIDELKPLNEISNGGSQIISEMKPALNDINNCLNNAQS